MEIIYKDKQHRLDYTQIADARAKLEIDEDHAKKLRRIADREAYERQLAAAARLHGTQVA